MPAAIAQTWGCNVLSEGSHQAASRADMRALCMGLTLSILVWAHAIDVSVGKQRIAKKAHDHQHVSGGGNRRPRPTKEFIYVYDMPSKFTADIAQLSPEWHPDQYDYDQVTATVMCLKRSPFLPSTESVYLFRNHSEPLRHYVCLQHSHQYCIAISRLAS